MPKMTGHRYFAEAMRGYGVTHLFYVTSSVYNPADEGRIPHDDPEIGYDWEAPPAIK